MFTHFTASDTLDLTHERLLDAHTKPLVGYGILYVQLYALHMQIQMFSLMAD